MSNIIVLFEVTVKNGRMEDYLKMADSLKDSLAKARKDLFAPSVFLPLLQRGNYLVCQYGKMKNAFQNGAILPHTVWRKNTGE